MKKTLIFILVLLGSLKMSAAMAIEFSNCEYDSEQYYCAKDIAYGEDKLQRFDLWLPNSPTKLDQIPLVIFIHGGGYAAGEKEMAYFQGTGIDRYLAAGYAFATINYRLSGTHPFIKTESTPHPVFMRDAGLAIQYMRAHAQDLKISTEQIALTGTSAGGGISLWLGLHDDLADPKSKDPVLQQSTRVSCVSVSATQTTLNIEEIESLLSTKEQAFEIDQRIPQFYGLPNSDAYLANPKFYQELLAESMKEASPITHLDEKDKDVKIKLSYSRDFSTLNIHGAEFGAYIATGRRQNLAKKYQRNNFRDLGMFFEYERALGREQNVKMVDFVLDHCF